MVHSHHLRLWFGSKKSERRGLGHKQFLTETRESFWSLGEDEMRPRELSGVFLVE
jgi:hypothetical protein